MCCVGEPLSVCILGLRCSRSPYYSFLPRKSRLLARPKQPYPEQAHRGSPPKIIRRHHGDSPPAGLGQEAFYSIGAATPAVGGSLRTGVRLAQQNGYHGGNPARENAMTCTGIDHLFTEGVGCNERGVRQFNATRSSVQGREGIPHPE